MPGSAVLSVWDGAKVVDLDITWSKGHDEDASVQVPAAWRDVWKAATARLSEMEEIRPYASLPIKVEPKMLNKSATGIYAVARAIFGRSAGWRVSPPYPKAKNAPMTPGVTE